MSILGKTIPHDSAVMHVTGTSKYINDIPMLPNELLVDFYKSPEAHGEIISLEIEEAKKVPGIAGIYTYKDITGVNKFGTITQDEFLLAETKIDFLHQPIVIIAGETKTAIEEAKKLIKLEIKKLPAIFTMEEAIEKQDFIGETYTILDGDPEADLKTAEHVFEGTFHTGAQEHFYFEPQSTIVYPDESNAVKVLSSTQNPTGVQKTVAAILGIPFNKIIVEVKRLGGGFGGKESQGAPFSAMAALVALKTQKPARFCLDADEDIKITGKRHPFMNKYKIGFTKEGEITSFILNLYSNGGYANDYSLSVIGRSMVLAESVYSIPNIKITGTVCRTNLPPNTAFRGFGVPQGVGTTESIIEDIAVFLKKDPMEIRRKNLYQVTEKNVTPYGQVLLNNTMPQIVEELVISSDYDNRVKKIKEFNAKSKNLVRGIAFMPVKFGIGFEIRFINQGSALVNIYLDGTVQVSTGGIEMGQGLNTKIQQIVASEFCLDAEKVRVMTTSSEKNNNASPTAASTGTDFNGGASENACKSIKKRLLQFASEYLYPDAPAIEYIEWTEEGIHDVRNPKKSIDFAELVLNAYFNSISLGERGFFTTPGIDFDWETCKGSPFHYFTYGGAVAEVEIDKFTGETKVLQTDILMDIGKSINPGIDKGQIIGGFMQGLGWSAMEEIKYSDKGEVLTHSATTYKIPGIGDVPEILNLEFLDNDTNIHNIKRSKAVGEPPFILGISVWLAIKNALSFLSDGEIVDLKIPATQEQVLLKIIDYLGKEK